MSACPTYLIRRPWCPIFGPGVSGSLPGEDSPCARLVQMLQGLPPSRRVAVAIVILPPLVQERQPPSGLAAARRSRDRVACFFRVFARVVARVHERGVAPFEARILSVSRLCLSTVLVVLRPAVLYAVRPRPFPVVLYVPARLSPVPI